MGLPQNVDGGAVAIGDLGGLAMLSDQKVHKCVLTHPISFQAEGVKKVWDAGKKFEAFVRSYVVEHAGAEGTKYVEVADVFVLEGGKPACSMVALRCDHFSFVD